MRKKGNTASMHLIAVTARVVVLGWISLLLPACVIANTYSNVERVVAISDVHGAYDSMVRTLSNAGVINDAMSWSAGVVWCTRLAK